MSKKNEIAQKLKTMLPGDAVCMDEAYKRGIAFSAQVASEKLRDVMTVCQEAWYFLESAAGLDFEDTLEVVYHLGCYEPGSRIALRVLCGHDQPDIPTVSDIFPAALWLEREIHEFFDIRFIGHPDLKPLLLPEDADYHPLRKNFGQVCAYRRREEIYGS